MKEEKHTQKAHLFICCRERDGKKASCAAKGSVEMVKELKSWIKKEGLKKEIKVSQSSCLGLCEEGITACLYPENTWFKEISAIDVDDLKKLLKDRA